MPRQYSDGNSPNGDVECRQKSRFSTNLWLLVRWLLECEQQMRRPTVQCSTQTTTHQWILFITISIDDHDEEKRTEQNSFVRSGKSEAEVTLLIINCARRIVLLLTTDRHQASRGLSATAWLIVHLAMRRILFSVACVHYDVAMFVQTRL